MVHPCGWNDSASQHQQIMYRKAEYSKGTKDSEILVVWLKEKPWLDQDKPFARLDVPDGSVVASFVDGKVLSYQLVPIRDVVTPSVLMDEFYRLWNFIQEKNWRGRVKDYDLVVGDKL